MFDMDISEVEKLILDLGRVGPEITPLVQTATVKALVDTEGTGKTLAAVDTGAMRASIGHDVDSDGMGGEVGPTVDYAPHQEYGTSKMPPQPFMGPAFVRHVEEYVTALESIGGRVLS